MSLVAVTRQESTLDRGLPKPNLATAVTIGGYAASLAYIATNNPALGVIGVVADEIDGRVARAMGQTSSFGREMDYAVDLTLTGLTAYRALGNIGLAVLPIVTTFQAVIRAAGLRPSFLSARALFTGAAILRSMVRS